MAIKSSRPMTLFESVMWGTSWQVLNILKDRDLTFDENWTDYALLVTALKRKRKEIAKILLNKGCRVQKIPKSDDSDTPLFYAVKMDDIEIVKILLSKGASISDKDQNGETPLCHAMKKRNQEMIDLILSTENIGSINVVNNEGLSHFHVACMRNNVDIVRNFLSHGIDIDHSVNFSAKEWPGFTALHFAVNNGSINVIKLLLNHGANPSIKNAEDMTSLHLAVQKQNDTIVDLILSSNNSEILDAVDENGFSHFHIACMKNHFKAVEHFLKQGVDINHYIKTNSPIWPGYTALHFAVKGFSTSSIPNSTSQTSLVEFLLQHKADVNAKDVQGQTPLHLACLQSDEKIFKLIQSAMCSSNPDLHSNEFTICNELCQIIRNKIEQSQIVELLIKYYSDVNVKNKFDETPMFYLYKNDRSKILTKLKHNANLFINIIKEVNLKRKEIIEILIHHNADVNLQNDAGQTILHLIAGINKESDDELKEEIAELILQKEADVDAKAKYGSTPLHIAAKNGHSKLIELFLKYKANVNACENSDKATPLHLATSYQQVKAINVLLKNNADVTITKSNGMNVIHIMALINPDGSEEAEFIEMYDKIIKMYIERQCDINAQDINGRTPLHLAAWDHNNAATWILIEHFADINIEDYGGETPLAFPINSTRRCVNIHNMFKDYVDILRLTGLYISEKTERSYSQLYENSDNNFDDSNDIFVQCKEELEKMKSIKINNITTLNDIIFKNSIEMEIYAGNELLESIINSGDFEKNFNIYGNFLKSQFRKGWARKKLIKNAKCALEFMRGSRLPDSCTEKLFQHLDDKSLNNLVEAKALTTCSEKIHEQKLAHDRSESAALEAAIAYCKNLFNKQMEMEIK